MEQKNEISILTNAAVLTRKNLGEVKIPIDKLSNEVEIFYNQIVEVFSNLKDSASDFRLEEITINAEVSGSGTISILGSGVEAGIKGGLSFKLVRKT